MIGFLIAIWIVLVIGFVMLLDCVTKPLKACQCKPEVKHEYIDNDLRL